MTNNFRTIAMALRPFVGGTYDLLEAADAVVTILPDLRDDTRPTITTPDGSATWDWQRSRWNFDHGSLVSKVLASDEAMTFLYQEKKVNAIKEVRDANKCGLKEAKEAVLDARVTEAVEAVLRDPWSIHSPDEPPF